MNTLDAIKARRSVKVYDAEYEIPEEEVKQLIELAILSPTAFNIQHWRFVVVRDKALREQIKAVSWNQAQVTDASLLIVLCADLKAWEKEPERYWKNAIKPVQDFLLPAIKEYYTDDEAVERDEALRSCGIAAQTIMLAAKAMGYDSCPMDGFDFDKVAELINLPDDHIISMFVVVGKAAAEANPRGGQLPLEDVLIKDRFS